MAGKRFKAVCTFLTRPLFGTRVIPRDARLDLETLAEADFPIYCEKCGYLLRGLPEERCPECGSVFDRRKLLLKQYVHDWFGYTARSSRVGRWVIRCCVAGILLILLEIGMGTLAGYLVRIVPAGLTSASAVQYQILWRVVYGVGWALRVGLLFVLLACLVFSAGPVRERIRKRRRVVRAILSE